MQPGHWFAKELLHARVVDECVQLSMVREALLAGGAEPWKRYCICMSSGEALTGKGTYPDGFELTMF